MKRIIQLPIKTFIILLVISPVLVYIGNGCSGSIGVGNESGLTGDSSGGSGGTGGGSTSEDSAIGKAFYDENIVSLFSEGGKCFQCHAAPRFGGTAPLTLTNYALMRSRLLDGSPTNNKFINKAQNIIEHTGGNQCSIFGITGSPCKEIVEWAQLESGSGSLPGALIKVQGDGKVQGWAVDFSNQSRVVEVKLYLDGPSGTGTFISSTNANSAGSNGGFTGHNFNFQLPNNLRNETQHDIYAYGINSSGAEIELPGSPYTFVAYLPKAQAFFANTVAPALIASCGNCHGNYDNFDASYSNRLIIPSPFEGGTATSNFFIDKALGLRNHGQGNVCGNVNNSPCSELVDWWNAEFN